MMSSPSAPPPPNYGPLADASMKNAEISREDAAANRKIQQEQLDWAKQQYAENKPFTQEVQRNLLKTLNTNTAESEQQLARYKQLYYPLEEKFLDEAKNYASPERMALERGKAVATAGQAADAAIANANKNLESFGVDPSAARFGALNTGAQMMRAASQAGAATASDKAVTDTGLALEGSAIGVGRGQPAQALQTQQAGTQAGLGGVNAGNTTTSTAAGSLGNPLGWAGATTGAMGGANSAIGNWGQILNAGYQNQLGAFNANQNASSGVGSAIGTGAGLLTSFAPMLMGFKRGGGVPALRAGTPRHAGGAPMGTRGTTPAHGLTPAGIAHAVPTAASPSGGARTDDVPAVGPGGAAIRVNAGEFILPVRTVQHFGTKFLQNLIAKGDKEQGLPEQPPAEPETKAVNTSGPMAGPLPTYANGGVMPHVRGRDHMHVTPNFRVMRRAA